MSYVVVGHYCPTDATPFEDSETEKTAAVAETREEAETAALWYPDAEIIPVRGTTPRPSVPDRLAEALGWGDFRKCSPAQQRQFAEWAAEVGLNHLGEPFADVSVGSPHE